ncbi:MAG: hypothetical protein ACOCV2_04715 [Persicimonas sp.]
MGLALVLALAAFYVWKDEQWELKAEELGLEVNRLFGVLAVGLIGEYDGMEVEVRRHSSWREHDSGHTEYTLDPPVVIPPDLEIRPRSVFEKLGSFVRNTAGQLTGAESDDEKGKSGDEEEKSFEEIFSIDSSDREEALDFLEESGVKQCLLQIHDEYSSVYVEEGKIGVKLYSSQTATVMGEVLDELVEHLEQLGSTPRSSDGPAFGPEAAAQDTGEGEHRVQANGVDHRERNSGGADHEETTEGDALW